jgi:tripartite-type tricarboxylate transporter receptor subunit TctC
VALSQVRSGRLVALGIGSDKRHPLLPELPTLSEAKAGEVNVDMWYGIFAPKGMPAAQVAALNREINDILRSEDVKKAFEGQGMDPASDTPDGFARLVSKDADRWAALIKAQGIKAE